MEAMALRLNNDDGSSTLIIVYMPFEDRHQQLIELSNLLSEFAEDNPIIMGDFNCPLMRWEEDEQDDNVILPFYTTESKLVNYEILQSIIAANFNQINRYPNPYGEFLDLVFCPAQMELSCEPVPAEFELHKPKPDHASFMLSIKLNSLEPENRIQSSNYLKNRVKNRFMTIVVQNLTESIDQIHNESHLDNFFSNFIGTYNTTFAQLSSPRTENSLPDPNWFRPSPELKILLTKMDKLRRHSKKCPTPTPEYIQARRQYSSLRDKERIACFQQLRTNPSKTTSLFYKYVNSNRKIKAKIPSVLMHDDIKLTGYQEIALAFLAQFGKISAASTSTPIDTYSLFVTNYRDVFEDDWLFIRDASEEYIRTEILSLSENKDPGPMKIASEILKADIDTAVIWICNLFGKCLEFGHIPSSWGQTYISPIPKKVNSKCTVDFRPITLSSVIPKLFDKLCTSFLLKVMGPKFHLAQHGFLPNRSTQSNLFEFSSRLFQGVNNSIQVDAVYFDLSKAFDTLDHSQLLRSLAGISMPFNLYSIFADFLLTRQVHIKMPDHISTDCFYPSKGVPQGSHMGPILFNLYINDIFSIFNNVFVSAYADDMKISCGIDSPLSISTLQDNINLFTNWVDTHGLVVNREKTFVVSYTKGHDPMPTYYYINGVLIQRVGKIKDLGVVFDQHLTFTDQHTAIISKTNQLIGFSSRWINTLGSVPLMVTFYKSYLLPFLEYCSIVWDKPGSETFLNYLESVQRRFTRMILHIPPDPRAPNYISYERRLIRLDMLKLEHRRIIAKIKFVRHFLLGEYKIRDQGVLLPVNPSLRVLRNAHKFVLPPYRNAFIERAPNNCVMNTYNQYIHLFAEHDSIDVIKGKLTLFFKNTYH